MIPLPWMILGVTLLIGSAGVVGYQQGSKHKANEIAAQQLRDAAILETAMQGAAEAIAELEVKQTTIRQKVETIIREVPVYTECRNTPDVVGLLNDALISGGESAGGGELPGIDAPGR